MTAQEMQAEIERLREHLDSTRTTVESIIDMTYRRSVDDVRLGLRMLHRDVGEALDPAQAAHERGWAQWRDRVNITR
jgi:hypothetical protein